jgi:hypothetical protein
MKKVIAAAGIGAALIAGPAVAAGSASADSGHDNYLYIQGLISNGIHIIDTNIAINTEAGEFLGYAVGDLCPQYTYLTQADVVTELAIANYTGPRPGFVA